MPWVFERLPLPRKGSRFSGAQLSTNGERSAFFCSNRYSNSSCGRTFSVLWSTTLRCCSLSTSALHALLSCRDASRSVARAIRKSRFSLSRSSAARWLKTFTRETSRLRSTLYRRQHPPTEEDASSSPESITLRMLDEAMKLEGDNDGTPDPLAHFQSSFQTSIVHP